MMLVSIHAAGTDTGHAKGSPHSCPTRGSFIKFIDGKIAVIVKAD